MRPPRVSVIICVYNRAIQVVTCLDSLLRLDFEDFEIVLVDDASTDDTPSTLESFRAAHPELAVTIVRNERNLGVSGARNAGLAATRGDFVAFTDSDCVVDSGWLRALIAGFTAPEIAGVGGRVFDAAPRSWAERAYVGTCRIGRGELQGRPVVGNNMAWRGDLVREHRFDAALSYYCDEDELAWRLADQGYRLAFAPRAITHHDHAMTWRGYLGMAARQGVGSARFWYKRGNYVGRDLFVLYAAVASAPLAFLGAPWSLIPVALLVLQLGMMLFNEIAFKGKRPSEALAVLPLVFLYNLVKSWSVFRTWLRMVRGGEHEIRSSKKEWRERRRR